MQMTKGIVELTDGWQTTRNVHYKVRRTGTLDITRDGVFVIKIDGQTIRARPGDSFSFHHEMKLDSENDLRVDLEFSIPQHED